MIFNGLKREIHKFADRGTTTGRRERGSRETDQVSLLPAQSAHLSATGVRRSTGLQCRVR